MDNYSRHKIGLLVPLLVFGSLAVMLWANPRGRRNSLRRLEPLHCRDAGGAAFALYPVVLPARDPQYDLTIYNTAAGSHGLSVGYRVVDFGRGPRLAYFVFIYRMFRGKVQLGEGHY